MQALDDEATRQAVDSHIDKALREVLGGRLWLSRAEFADEVQRRGTQDISSGFPVRDRIDELLDTFMSRDDIP